MPKLVDAVCTSDTNANLYWEMSGVSFCLRWAVGQRDNRRRISNSTRPVFHSPDSSFLPPYLSYNSYRFRTSKVFDLQPCLKNKSAIIYAKL